VKYCVLYRGPLSSCNYSCAYCPFAKRHETHQELEGDRQGLDRFLAWISEQRHRQFGVLFTPWGEALIRKWYQEALVRLTHMPHIHRAVIQTNLSCALDWVSRCRIDRLALWATFHPTEVERSPFVAKVKQLRTLGVRLSVGAVGIREHLGQIQKLREEIPAEVYVWVNAYKRVPNYYEMGDVNLLTNIDPLFPLNNQRHPSLREPCWSGETSFTVDGQGIIRRCHFISEPLGRIADPDWESALRPRACTNATCGCHIGYVHLKRLRLYDVFGDGVLERIPEVGFDQPATATEHRTVSPIRTKV
jgi:MoaA/NifB/PqqE/SkfB family radical SAM enzyme